MPFSGHCAGFRCPAVLIRTGFSRPPVSFALFLAPVQRNPSPHRLSWDVRLLEFSDSSFFGSAVLRFVPSLSVSVASKARCLCTCTGFCYVWSFLLGSTFLGGSLRSYETLACHASVGLKNLVEISCFNWLKLALFRFKTHAFASFIFF